MSHQLVIFACVLRSIEHGPPPDERCHTPYVLELVAAVEKYSERYGVPAEIEVAKIWHESNFRKRARGRRGEIGLGQLLRNGAIQGRDMRLTDHQLEDVDTNVRISTWYLSRFVRECNGPSQWLTKYNRPASGCRSSRYSRGVLADLRLGRQVFLYGSRSPYDTEASGSSGQDLLTTSPSTEAGSPEPDHTSRTEAGRFPATLPDIGERLPSGIRRAVGTRERTLEELLAEPFGEP